MTQWAVITDEEENSNSTQVDRSFATTSQSLIQSFIIHAASCDGNDWN
ncbi:hypothetical protein ACEQPO_23100 [Bacillus sp. SL00103]